MGVNSDCGMYVVVVVRSQHWIGGQHRCGGDGCGGSGAIGLLQIPSLEEEARCTDGEPSPGAYSQGVDIGMGGGGAREGGRGEPSPGADSGVRMEG